MKRLKILFLALIMVVAVSVTSVSFATWIYTKDTEQTVDVSSGAWDASATNTYNIEYDPIYGEDKHVSAYMAVGFKSEMVGSIVRIPSTYNDLPVVAIASSFCQGELERMNLYKLVIPASVIAIEADSLSYLNMLNTLVIEGNGLKFIGDRALSNCNLLSKVILPSSITGIGNDVLSNCINLTAIDVLAIESKINVNNGNQIVNFGLKSDGSYPAITFAKEAL